MPAAPTVRVANKYDDEISCTVDEELKYNRIKRDEVKLEFRYVEQDHRKMNEKKIR